ncbi:MAG: fructosamine kinase family protein [Flavisolibacter sp.]|jgi:protein-ribulosamine 3-kinase|nr:fructosamine kinase family protein [Flavisolibacter sp.]
MQPQLQNAIKQKLSEQLSLSENMTVAAVGGGSINETYQLNFGDRKIFCKLNSATMYPRLFLKEQAGLALIAKQGIIKTPSAIDCFEASGYQILLLEWIEEGERTQGFWKKFGEQLAALHQLTNNSFGLDEDNYMGSVPQQNNTETGWITFFIHQRLHPMINRCSEKNLLASTHHQQFEKLFVKLPDIFEPTEKPSLLHGDLWSGNFMCNQNKEPVLIDPAVYYGHRCMDLAMTTLFGGFHKSFYETYDYHFPFPANYKEQWAVCNLYPLLIHLYLFGRSYLPQIEQTLIRFK